MRDIAPPTADAMRRLAPLFAVAVLLGTAVEADAHLNLVEPASRYDKYTLKNAPCGKGDGPRSSDVATFRAGETITVVWNEYVDHPGHYRIAFDRDGQDDFEPPTCTSGCETRQPEFQGNVNDAVLVDDIDDKVGGEYRTDVTLPDVTCDNCTLQVIQVMYDKEPYKVPGDDLYYQCADLKLVDDGGSMDAGGDTSDAGGGGDTSTPDTGGSTDTGGSADTGEMTSDGGSDTGESSPADTSGGGEDTGSGDRETDDAGASAGGSGENSSGIEKESGCHLTGGKSPAPLVPVTMFLLIAAVRRRS